MSRKNDQMAVLSPVAGCDTPSRCHEAFVPLARSGSARPDAAAITIPRPCLVVDPTDRTPAWLSIPPTAPPPAWPSCRLHTVLVDVPADRTPRLVGLPADRTPAWPPLPRAGPQREKTTVRLPFMRTRRSAWKRTAWARTRRSTSWPRATMSGVESAWETRVTSCSMIGPSSRSAVT